MRTSKSSQFSLIFAMYSVPDGNRRLPLPASLALSPSAMTRTRTVLPVPAGRTTVPRTA